MVGAPNTLWQGRLEWTDRLKPQPWDHEAEGTHVGGFRSTRRTLALLPGMVETSELVSKSLDEYFDRRPDSQFAILEAIRLKIEDGLNLDGHIDDLVMHLAELLERSDPRRGIDMGFHCEIRPYLLAAWRRRVGHPDE